MQNMQQPSNINPVGRATQGMNLKQKASVVAGLALFPAMTVMVFLRKRVGYRFLDPMKILGMGALLFGLAWLSAAFPSGQMNQPTGYAGYGAQTITTASSPLTAGLGSLVFIGFALAMMIIGLWERHLRRKDIGKGVSWHTYSRGVPRLAAFLPFNETIIKRFVDPAVCLIVGVVLSFIFHWLGVYLVFAAFCLFVFETWDFDMLLNRELDTLDDLVDNAVMSQNVEWYEQQGAREKPLEQTAGIPTGIAPDVAVQIARRRAQQQPQVMQGMPIPTMTNQLNF